ncbi:DNA/RNA non-specific endonuclease [Methylobacterium planeticum]|uniref:Endonuclease n=1 Tax=Methylobacterium planeticum TaxID=2615211 RepID=A0A6N6MCB2_9HYPH|nr:DNA/RNA non-specific endonuclease [Methylobacterium planeticum]KAB1068266.1 DNA/RNA non-specific endonuclease [Methylobacterium planeticum]
MALAPDALRHPESPGVLLGPRRARPWFALLVVLVAGEVRAADTCPSLFADGAPPVLTNPRLAADTASLCYDAFAVLHSGTSRTPLYAAERLTRGSVAAARRVDRADAFHDEDRLPPDARARIEDYVHTGYDRGHMAPAGDMPTGEAQAQSFSLANIVPQNRAFNRGLWAAIEESVRRFAGERGEIFVVTGPIFEGRTAQSIKGRVLVPTQLFKAVYDPARAEAGAYLAPNRADADWQAVSLDALRDLSGLDVFPTLPDAVKARAMSLPEPREYSRGDAAEGRQRPREEDWGAWARAELLRILRRTLRDVLRSIF